MKKIVVLYAGDSSARAFEKSFGGRSAFESVLDWAGKIGGKVVVLLKKDTVASSFVSAQKEKEIEVVEKDGWTKRAFVSEISDLLSGNDADCAVVSYADTPFLSVSLTEELVRLHADCSAEYTFADGFPYGITPEIVDAGAASIISALAERIPDADGEMDRNAIFSLVRADINSFEVETLISETDYRLLRLEFEASSKRNCLACVRLFEAASAERITPDDSYAVCDMACRSAFVLQTVPAFYSIQISTEYNHGCVYDVDVRNTGMSAAAQKPFMSLEDFKKIVGAAASFSEKAVVSLSAFGEPLRNPQFREFVRAALAVPGISLLVETDGLLVTEELAAGIASVASDCNSSVDWIVSIDAAERSLYSEIHRAPESDFDRAVAAVSVLARHFKNHVYPQMTRMNANECALEPFYRFWKNRESPSGGKLIIKKYNSYCGMLSDEKPADMSPLERIPCWHLRRDMTVLCDGTVPFCQQLSFAGSAGNILDESIDVVWGRIRRVLENHIYKNYPENCGICDESYTFNF